MLAALAQDGEAVRFASSPLQTDLEVVMAAVQQSGWALEFVLEEWQNHPQVVHAAVSQEGGALACAAERFRADRSIVLAAVSAPHEDPWREATALHFAAPELQADKVCLIFSSLVLAPFFPLLASYSENILCVPGGFFYSTTVPPIGRFTFYSNLSNALPSNASRFSLNEHRAWCLQR